MYLIMNNFTSSLRYISVFGLQRNNQIVYNPILFIPEEVILKPDAKLKSLNCNGICIYLLITIIKV